MACDPVDSEQQLLDDRDGILVDGITWMSPEQVDLLSEDEKKVVVNKMVTTITVSFDGATNKHQIDVTFSETVARVLADPAGDLRSLTNRKDPMGSDSMDRCNLLEDAVQQRGVKKSVGSSIKSAADLTYPVTVE